jgi:hypothetical protein
MIHAVVKESFPDTIPSNFKPLHIYLPLVEYSLHCLTS